MKRPPSAPNDVNNYYKRSLHCTGHTNETLVKNNLAENHLAFCKLCVRCGRCVLTSTVVNSTLVCQKLFQNIKKFEKYDFRTYGRVGGVLEFVRSHTMEEGRLKNSDFSRTYFVNISQLVSTILSS